MRKIFMVALLMQISGAFADVRTLTRQEAATTNLEARRIAQEISDIYDNANCQNTTDDIISRACALHNDELTKSLILLYATEKVMLSYYDEIKGRMEQKSKSSGRKLETESQKDAQGVSEERFWLGRGDMDSKKCQWDFKKKIACDYPDGFEEFSAELFDSNPDGSKDDTMMILNVTVDNPAENKVNIIHILLLSQEDKTSNLHMIGVRTEVAGTEYNYKEFYTWKNQTAQDIRNGKIIKVPKKQQNAMPGVRIEWMTDKSREWASSHVPDSIGFSYIKDASNVTAKTRD